MPVTIAEFTVNLDEMVAANYATQTVFTVGDLVAWVLDNQHAATEMLAEHSAAKLCINTDFGYCPGSLCPSVRMPKNGTTIRKHT